MPMPRSTGILPVNYQIMGKMPMPPSGRYLRDVPVVLRGGRFWAKSHCHSSGVL